MKYRYKEAYMDFALRFAELSYARRLRVGAIVVKDDRVISLGYNGQPSGWDNICEDEVIVDGEVVLVTKPTVLHAEANALMKLAKSPESGDGSALFITHSPCIECAKMIYQAGIKEVYYRTLYRSTKGLDFLEKCNIHVEQI